MGRKAWEWYRQRLCGCSCCTSQSLTLQWIRGWGLGWERVGSYQPSFFPMKHFFPLKKGTLSLICLIAFSLVTSGVADRGASGCIFGGFWLMWQAMLHCIDFLSNVWSPGLTNSCFLLCNIDHGLRTLRHCLLSWQSIDSTLCLPSAKSILGKRVTHGVLLTRSQLTPGGRQSGGSLPKDFG